MAWVAVNKDGSEICSNEKPLRRLEFVKKYMGEDSEVYKCCLRYGDYWCDEFESNYNMIPQFNGVELPQGSIKKLIGRELTWEDNPVEI